MGKYVFRNVRIHMYAYLRTCMHRSDCLSVLSISYMWFIVYIYIYIYMYMYTHMYTYIHTHIHTYTIHVHKCVCTYAQMCVYTHICTTQWMTTRSPWMFGVRVYTFTHAYMCCRPPYSVQFYKWLVPAYEYVKSHTRTYTYAYIHTLQTVCTVRTLAVPRMSSTSFWIIRTYTHAHIYLLQTVCTALTRCSSTNGSRRQIIVRLPHPGACYMYPYHTNMLLVCVLTLLLVHWYSSHMCPTDTSMRPWFKSNMHICLSIICT